MTCLSGFRHKCSHLFQQVSGSLEHLGRHRRIGVLSVEVRLELVVAGAGLVYLMHGHHQTDDTLEITSSPYDSWEMMSVGFPGWTWEENQTRRYPWCPWWRRQWSLSWWRSNCFIRFLPVEMSARGVSSVQLWLERSSLEVPQVVVTGSSRCVVTKQKQRSNWALIQPPNHHTKRPEYQMTMQHPRDPI